MGLEGCKLETVEVILSWGKIRKVSTVDGGLLFDVVKNKRIGGGEGDGGRISGSVRA